MSSGFFLSILLQSTERTTLKTSIFLALENGILHSYIGDLLDMKREKKFFWSTVVLIWL